MNANIIFNYVYKIFNKYKKNISRKIIKIYNIYNIFYNNVFELIDRDQFAISIINTDDEENNEIIKHIIYKNNYYINSYIVMAILLENNKEIKEEKTEYMNKMINFSKVRCYNNSHTKMCAICYNNIKKKAIIRKLKCGHMYHINCIEKWFSRELSCPCCREIPNE